jgi:hypothetical protein
MRLLRSVSEDDMVAAFLAAEAASEGYGPQIRQILARLGQPHRLVTDPDTRDDAANAVRRQVPPIATTQRATCSPACPPTSGGTGPC